MQDALRRAGAHPTGFSQGDIFLVPNPLIRLDVDMRLSRIPAKKSRPVIVMDSDERCRDGRILSVMVIPMTSNAEHRAPTTHLLPATTEGLSAESLALVHLIQPLDRNELTREGYRIGRLAEDQVEILIVKLAWAVGMAGLDDD